jgi:hypothetical protein
VCFLGEGYVLLMGRPTSEIVKLYNLFSVWICRPIHINTHLYKVYRHIYTNMHWEYLTLYIATNGE